MRMKTRYNKQKDAFKSSDRVIFRNDNAEKLYRDPIEIAS